MILCYGKGYGLLGKRPHVTVEEWEREVGFELGEEERSKRERRKEGRKRGVKTSE